MNRDFVCTQLLNSPAETTPLQAAVIADDFEVI